MNSITIVCVDSRQLFHERTNKIDLNGQISRGILPLEYLSSKLEDDEWYDNLELALGKKTIGNESVSLKKIGGFTLLYGQLAINPKTGKINHLNILSNRGDHGKVHESEIFDTSASASHDDVAHLTTFGVSNSLYYEPWPKVELGKKEMRNMIKTSIDEKYDHRQVIDACFNVLSQDTFDREKADKLNDLNDKFLELRKSVFIPPLKTGLLSPGPYKTMGTYYGTRTQTVIALHKSGALHYYERDIHSTDKEADGTTVEEHHFEFLLPKE